jgi:hypothetical protein
MNQNQHEWEQEMPPEFQSAINRVRANPPPPESVERFIRIAAGIEITAAEWKRGGFTKWIWIGALLSLVLPAIVALRYFPELDRRAIGPIVAGVIATLVFVNFFGGWARSRRNAGAILLDCGNIPSRGFLTFFAAIFLALTLGSITFAVKNVATIFSPEGAIAIAWIGLCLATLVYQCMTIWGRLQFRSNGIWCYIGLVPWKQVVSWNWTGRTGSTLLVKSKSRFGRLTTGALPIPPDRKARVEDLLTTHTGKAPLDSSPDTNPNTPGRS